MRLQSCEVWLEAFPTRWSRSDTGFELSQCAYVRAAARRGDCAHMSGGEGRERRGAGRTASAVGGRAGTGERSGRAGPTAAVEGRDGCTAPVDRSHTQHAQGRQRSVRVQWGRHGSTAVPQQRSEGVTSGTSGAAPWHGVARRRPGMAERQPAQCPRVSGGVVQRCAHPGCCGGGGRGG